MPIILPDPFSPEAPCHAHLRAFRHLWVVGIPGRGFCPLALPLRPSCHRKNSLRPHISGLTDRLHTTDPRFNPKKNALITPCTFRLVKAYKEGVRHGEDRPGRSPCCCGRAPSTKSSHVGGRRLQRSHQESSMATVNDVSFAGHLSRRDPGLVGSPSAVSTTDAARHRLTTPTWAGKWVSNLRQGRLRDEQRWSSRGDAAPTCLQFIFQDSYASLLLPKPLATIEIVSEHWSSTR